MARTADSRRLVGFAAFLTSVVVALALAGSAHAATFTVTKTEDTNDGACDADCSLREAITAANGNGEADVINVPAGTYPLTFGDQLGILADETLTIAGAGARTTIVDQQTANERVIDIDPQAVVEISDMTITGGDSPDDGGGIDIDDTGLEGMDAIVTLRRVIVTGNRTNDTGEDGGGIDNEGELTVIDSTVSNNSALGDSGGIENDDSLVLINTTISGNEAGTDGGGIGNDGDDLEPSEFDGPLVVTNSTIVNNTAAGVGGGIENEPSTTEGGGGVGTYLNTIVANNTSSDPASANCLLSAQNTSQGDNIENLDTCGFNATGDRPNTDPLLGPLQNNGGPTDTHALLAGSPAIDAAGADCPATDQRGVTRPQGPACDIGAYEVEVAAVQQQQQQQTQAQTQIPAVVPTAGPPVIDTTAPRASIAGVRRACVASNFTVRIRARDTNLRRVRVFLDGRRIRSTTQSSLVVTVRARRLKAGRHRLTVVASDEAGNRRRVSRTFARCARLKAPPAPRFTG